MISGYTKILAVGHKFIDNLFEGTIVIEEKIDGSQFSFGKINGELFCKSHHKMLDLENPGMFGLAVKSVLAVEDLLIDGCTYRGEFLSKPKHNTLAYNRVPTNNIIIFDIDLGNQNYCSPDEKKRIANNLGFECVPCYYYGYGNVAPKPESFLSLDSILGGQKIEGVVIKNYDKIGRDGKVIMGKLVSPKFKEIHQSDWKNRTPARNDFMQDLANKYLSEARWNKAVQHLNESDELLHAPQDIPNLMKEVSQDVLSECQEEIKDELFKFFWKRYGSKTVARGLPQWYKEKLND